MPTDWDNWLNDADSNDIRLADTELSENDQKLKAIFECAFPQGLKYREWSQLIYMMKVADADTCPMSAQAVAHNVGILLNVQYVYLLNEVYGLPQIKPLDKVLAWLKQRLEKCGYYEWLKDDTNIQHIEAGMLDELHKQLITIRPCKVLTLKRKSIPSIKTVHDQQSINAFVRIMLSFDKDWHGIQWFEVKTHDMWEELLRILQYDREHTTRYMSRKEAHAFVGAITKLLNEDDSKPRYYTNHRGGGLWTPLTDTRWQYWLVTTSPSSIGIFGLEED